MMSAPVLPLVEMRGVTKHYGMVRAVHNVDLSIGHREIVALVGDNGAGKSTLVKILSGAVAADRGTIRVGGRDEKISSPLDSRALGIETIYQDLALLPNLDVVSNIFLGREEVARGIFRFAGILARRRMVDDARRHLADLKINIPNISGTPVGSLSGGQRQSVAIARSAAWASKLMIMDEPTAALGVAQSQAVLDLAVRVRDRGASILVISHILPHVLDLADRIVVMRHGEKVADVTAEGITQDELIELIVGFKRQRPSNSTQN
jgi:simple sugar transport system ATP-binding protein